MENNKKKNELEELLWTSEKDTRSSGNHGAITNGSRRGGESGCSGGCGGGCINCCIACCSVPNMITKWICN